MPIAKEAIQRYLARPTPAVRNFKGVDSATLHRYIYEATKLPFEPKTPPRGAHQLEGIAFALNQRSGLMFYDPQLGKTWIALNWAEHLKRAGIWRHGKGLVIAHSPVGLDVWEDQTAQHSNLKLRVVHLEFDDLAAAIESDCDLIVIPWSALQQHFTRKGISRKGKSKLYPEFDFIELAAECFRLCIIDEIHMCQNHLSLRFLIGAAITKHCRFRLGLTGTPFGRDPFALWGQTFLIDRGRALGYNYYFFEQAFGEEKQGWVGTEWKFDKKRMPELSEKIKHLSLICKRSEVFDIPVFEDVVKLRMRDDQAAAYKDVVNKLIELDADRRVEIQDTFHRLRQVSSGYLPFEHDDLKHVIHFKRNPKLEWLSDFVENAPPDVQVIIFHEYTHTGELISKLLTKLKAKFGWVYGGAKDSSIVIDHFKSGKLQFFLANTAKGGTSLSLPMADYIIFFESPVSPITREQARSRPMARGERSLMIDDLVCSGVERRILEFIAEGRDLMAALARERRSFY